MWKLFHQFDAPATIEKLMLKQKWIRKFLRFRSLWQYPMYIDVVLCHALGPILEQYRKLIQGNVKCELITKWNALAQLLHT
jgi:hypothetical protein